MQSMSGTIQNGQVVLDEPLPLPDGARVWVEALLPDNELSPDEHHRRAIGRQSWKKFATFEELLGAGKDLWDSDEELEEFLRFVRRKRGHSD